MSGLPDTIEVHLKDIVKRTITNSNRPNDRPTIVFTRVTAIEHYLENPDVDVVGFDAIIPKEQSASGSRLFAQGLTEDGEGALLLAQRDEDYGIHIVFEVIGPDSVPNTLKWSDEIAPNLRP